MAKKVAKKRYSLDDIEKIGFGTPEFEKEVVEPVEKEISDIESYKEVDSEKLYYSYGI